MKTEHAKRVAGEFVVIVLGVLVALAVDDVRAGRADRDLEAYYLEALTQDLAADTAELRWLLMIQDSVVVAGHRLSEHLDDPLVRPLPAELTDVDVPLARASALVMEPLDFESTRATYDEMVASGSLRVVRSATLRRALAEYYLAVERLANAEAGAARIATEQYQLAVRRHGYLAFEPIYRIELIDRLRGDDQALVTIRGAASRVGLLGGYQRAVLGQADALLAVLRGDDLDGAL